MDDSRKANVILFPKTVEYYQIELTRLIEKEQYPEATDLLRFLLQCSPDQAETREEWRVLLEWLETMISSEFGDEEEDLDEEELFSRHVKSKAEKDSEYTKKLLDMLLQDPSLEKKIIALDQLVHIDHPQINRTLKRWLETVEFHPLIQFKVLQTLKLRNVDGRVTVQRGGEKTLLDIDETPPDFNGFPETIHRIMRKVQESSEISHPALAYFAEQTWKEFISLIYGTAAYQRLASLTGEEEKMWAAALHMLSVETMMGPVSRDAVLRDYEVDRKSVQKWEIIYHYMKRYIGAPFTPQTP